MAVIWATTLLVLAALLVALVPQAGRAAPANQSVTIRVPSDLARKDAEPVEAPSLAMGVGELHAAGITGEGVTVAVIDSGLAPLDGRWQQQNDGSLLLARGSGRGGFVVYRDFVAPTGDNSSDPNGHGTHVVGTIANSRPLKSSGKGAMGVAPGVNLVVARALEADGSASYATVIKAIDWVIANRSTYNIRVLNLSLYAPIAGPYWADPLAQATLRAWQAGIVVVVAAGNSGPAPASITVPGNVPYLISVGAGRSARFSDSGNDEVANFSSRGPTEAAFAKPDLVAPAVRVIAPMPDNSVLAQSAAAGRLEEKARLDLIVGKTKNDLGYYQLSGSSMAAAEVSGLVALLLQAQPQLSNDQIKHRLMSSARLAYDATAGVAAYSIWEQGAGLVQSGAALRSTSTAAANAGLNIAADLDPQSTQRHWGLTSYDAPSGSFSLPPVAGTPPGYLVWSGAGRAWAGSLSWSGDPEVWAGAGRAWAGAGRAWAGSSDGWMGNEELWAGAGRAWAGALPPTLGSTTHGELDVDSYQLRLPLLAAP